MCGQNAAILHRKPRCLYSPGYNLDLKINIMSDLFTLEESVGLLQSKLLSE